MGLGEHKRTLGLRQIKTEALQLSDLILGTGTHNMFSDCNCISNRTKTATSLTYPMYRVVKVVVEKVLFINLLLYAPPPAGGPLL